MRTSTPAISRSFISCSIASLNERQRNNYNSNYNYVYIEWVLVFYFLSNWMTPKRGRVTSHTKSRGSLSPLEKYWRIAFRANGCSPWITTERSLTSGFHEWHKVFALSEWFGSRRWAVPSSMEAQDCSQTPQDFGNPAISSTFNCNWFKNSVLLAVKQWLMISNAKIVKPKDFSDRD